MAEALDVQSPKAARIYDFILGGKDNFQVDRDAAEAMDQASGGLFRTSARANRRFMARVADYLAREGNFHNFLDIGTGLPTPPNLHDIVQGIHLDANVAYVDNDPLVLAHAMALLTSAPGATGSVSYLDADVLKPDTIFGSEESNVLDLSQPVAVTALAILQLVDDHAAMALIDDVMSRLVPGSALAISLVVDDEHPEAVGLSVTAAQERGVPVRARSAAQLGAFFSGMDLLAPGVVPVHRWRPDEQELTHGIEESQLPVGMWCGVAIKR